MDLNQDYKEILKVLNECRVRYLIIGAYATIYYTEPRYTKDLDIWIERDFENITNLYKALKKFGAPLRNISEEDFMDKGTIYQIGVEPVRIDIVSDLAGINFKQAWKAKTKAKYDDVPVSLIGLNDLIKSKEKAGRKQDEIDIEKLLPLRKRRKGK
ncbi:MAG: nucleotidyltransferase [Elusimicrobia bacterium]|nr:nucleotidyltransferase [Elusimicrobiota bacterium]